MGKIEDHLVRAFTNYGIKKLKLKCHNPFAHLDIDFKNVYRNRERYLRKEQIVSLLIRCEEDKNKFGKSNPNVYNAVYLAILTAGRKMTILSVQKKSFDFDNKILHLYNYKTEKFYKVFLPDEAINYFQKFLKDFDNDEYVIKDFKSKIKKKQPFRAIPKRVYEILDEMFNQGLDKSNNEDRNQVINFHSLRRSVATNLALSNVSIFKIMKLLNHSDIAQTQKYLALPDLDMTTEVENTHSDIYEYIKLKRETLQSSKSALEYLEYLKDDNFSSQKDISAFEKQISDWSFKLENEFDDNFTVNKFSTVEYLKHYLEYRNEFSTINEYHEETNLTI